MENLSKYFKTIEMYNKCEDYYHTLKSGNVDPHWFISPLLVEGLEEVRKRMGTPIIINSGYRTPAHNILVGGAKNSMHLYGLAADISCPDATNDELYDCVRGVAMFKGMGKGKGFCHCDVRNSDVVVEWKYG